MVGFVAAEQLRVDAFRAESAALAQVAAGLADADLQRASRCPPWTLGGLLGHVVVAAGRIEQAIAAVRDAATAPGPLVTAAGYYRPDHRFSAGVNADRIDVAAALADRLGSAAAVAAELAAAADRSLALLTSAPPVLEVRTRHGDRMLLTDFAVTRVVELGVHGLDAAIALDREPWLTDPAATVLEDLLLPDAVRAGDMRALLRCDRAGLIARLTGRVALRPEERAALAGHGVTTLALG
jgi:uncharacterized protein (TIGR03083 family)